VDLPRTTEIESASAGGMVLWIFFNILLLPLWFILLMPIWTSLITVNPQEEILVLFFGKLNRIYKKPGIYCYSWVGRTTINMSLKTQTIDIKKNYCG